MPRKNAQAGPEFTPYQKNAVGTVEHLLGLSLGAGTDGRPGLTLVVRDQVIDFVLHQAGVVLQKEIRHLFHHKTPPPPAAKE